MFMAQIPISLLDHVFYSRGRQYWSEEFSHFIYSGIIGHSIHAAMSMVLLEILPRPRCHSSLLGGIGMVFDSTRRIE